jgi:hypothetical protein
MTLKPLLPAILLALVMSVVVAVLAAGRGSGATLAVAVGLYVVQVAFAAARVNTPFWQAPAAGSAGEQRVACVWNNAVLAALVYAWAATAMFAIYSISGLAWRHWWEYGAGMSLFAVLLLLYTYALAAGQSALRSLRALNIIIALTAVQAGAMVMALLFLAFSGKMHTLRDDWAANYVFIAGSLMLLLVSITAVLTYRHLGQRRMATDVGDQRWHAGQ